MEEACLAYPVTLGAIRFSILHKIWVLQVQCIVLKASGLLHIAGTIDHR